jgi:DNA primase
VNRKVPRVRIPLSPPLNMSQTIDQIKDRLDIIEVVREYVPALKKAGANWKSPCPFHQEKTPSFMVSHNKGIWHCFGCGKGGDVFGFIKEIEGVEFGDSLRLLAKRAGVKLEKQDPKKETERARLLEILRVSSNWYYQALLKSKSGEYARSYIQERALTDQTRDSWQLGFAPDSWEGLLTYLRTRGYKNEEIIKAGLASQNNRGGLYDRFRNRLMFPITDVHGTIVGFTGRKLSEDDPTGKYINTPETALYHKSEVLYGLSKAKQAIRKEGFVIVVEGNMDCISSHQAGIENVVAVSGTAMTVGHVGALIPGTHGRRLLQRYTKDIYLAFDPDTAGQDALFKGLEFAWQEGVNIKVIPLREGKDPDDIIRENPEQWKQQITEAQDFMEWLFVKTTHEHDASTAIGKKNIAQTLLTWIKRIPDPIEQTHYLQQLAATVRVEENLLRAVLAKKTLPVRRLKSTSVSTHAEIPERGIAEKISIRLLALYIVQKTAPSIPEYILPNQDIVQLYKNIRELYDSHVDSLDLNLQTLAREVLLVASELEEHTTQEERTQEIGALEERLKSDYTKSQLQEIRLQIESAERAGDVKALERHLNKWQQLNSTIQLTHGTEKNS